MRHPTATVNMTWQTGVLIYVLPEMTALEVWSLGCISVVFGTILTYAIILSRDQMIIQGVLNSEGELVEETNAQQQKVAWSVQEDKTRLSLKVKYK